MLVEESRILQCSIFGTLQKNLDSIDCSEVLKPRDHGGRQKDSQLKQTTISYMQAEAVKRFQAIGEARS
jgi:hypothetical protein